MHDLSGLEINIILKEFNQLIGSYIDKFYEIDKNIFNIIIDNLVSNAVKFSNENGIIHI